MFPYLGGAGGLGGGEMELRKGGKTSGARVAFWAPGLPLRFMCLRGTSSAVRFFRLRCALAAVWCT